MELTDWQGELAASARPWSRAALTRRRSNSMVNGGFEKKKK